MLGGCEEEDGSLFTLNYPLRASSPYVSYLISNEKFILDGECSRVGGAEPPRRPEDGVPRTQPFLAVLQEQRHDEVAVPLYALPGQVQDLQRGGEKGPVPSPSSNRRRSQQKNTARRIIAGQGARCVAVSAASSNKGPLQRVVEKLGALPKATNPAAAGRGLVTCPPPPRF